jgi:hypothetical protein
MSVGIGRNAANWVCRQRRESALAMLVAAIQLPGVICVTNVDKTRDGIHIRAKRIVEE